MTTFALSLTPKTARLAVDTMNTEGSIGSKYLTLPHIGGALFVTGRAVILDHIMFNLSRLRKLERFDDLVNVAERLCNKAFVDTAYEMMDSEGIEDDLDPWEYLQDSAYGVLTAHVFFIGYHHGLKEMCAASISYDKEDGEYQEHKHAIRPTSFQGAAPNALTDLEKIMGRDLGESDKDCVFSASLREKFEGLGYYRLSNQ